MLSRAFYVVDFSSCARTVLFLKEFLPIHVFNILLNLRPHPDCGLNESVLSRNPKHFILCLQQLFENACLKHPCKARSRCRFITVAFHLSRAVEWCEFCLILFNWKFHSDIANFISRDYFPDLNLGEGRNRGP